VLDAKRGKAEITQRRKAIRALTAVMRKRGLMQNNDPAMARVNVAFAGSADLPTGNANRTIEFWAFVLASSWNADANTMFFYGTNNRVADGFGLDFGANMGTQGTIDPFTNAIFDNDNQPSGVQANVSQWVHFAMTWDGTTVRAFVNGVEKASKAAPASSTQKTLMTGVTALTIGGYSPAFFNGQIDEFRIWSVARTASEITARCKTLVGNEAGLRLLEVRRDVGPDRRRLGDDRRPHAAPGDADGQHHGQPADMGGLDRTDQLPLNSGRGMGIVKYLYFSPGTLVASDCCSRLTRGFSPLGL
jgi:hypothetical protein